MAAAPAGPSTMVELRFACSDVPDLDLQGPADNKSDIKCVVLSKSGRKWHVIGQTETIDDVSSAHWLTPVKLEYFFEEQQRLKFVVVDVDFPNKPYTEQELIGKAECTLGDVVSSAGHTKAMHLRNEQHPDRSNGILRVMYEEIAQATKTILTMRLCGRGLDKMDFLSKSDPFLIFNRPRPDGTLLPVHQTETIMNDLDPNWKPFEISLQDLCNGDVHKKLVVECYDWDGPEKRDFIGVFETTATELMAGRASWPLINAKKKKKKKKYKNSGMILLEDTRVNTLHTFLEYLAGGCEVSLVVAIDFTASNGSPQDPKSLHYNRPPALNQYQKAIMAVGEVVVPYDADHLVPVTGFGAKIKGTPHDCFDMSPHDCPPGSPCYGVEGVLAAYNHAFSYASLFGPTNFAPTVRYAAEMAAQHVSQEDQKYFVLLIITDGEITDMDQTMEAIVDASHLPLSIIIVGVGNSTFVNMQRLDGDEVRLAIRGKTAERDIVQFVRFADYSSGDAALLAKDTLKEVPEQLESFMRLRKFTPNPPVEIAGGWDHAVPPPYEPGAPEAGAPPTDPGPPMYGAPPPAY